MKVKPKKTWTQKNARHLARQRDNPRKICFSLKHWNKKGEREYVIFDEKNERYICSESVFNNIFKSLSESSSELKVQGVSYFTTKNRSLARCDYKSGGQVDYIIKKIKHTGAWRGIRIK